MEICLIGWPLVNNQMKVCWGGVDDVETKSGTKITYPISFSNFKNYYVNVRRITESPTAIVNCANRTISTCVLYSNNNLVSFRFVVIGF